MARIPKIRWRGKDEKALQYAVSAFNAKLTRLLKQNPQQADYLPSRIVVKNERQDIKTRKDFNNKIREIRRFLDKGAEKPVTTASGKKTTKYELNELRIKTNAINRKRKQRLAEVQEKEVVVGSRKMGYKRGEMGSIRENELKPKVFNPDKIKPGKEWDAFVNSVEKQFKERYFSEKDELFKANYIKGLMSEFGDDEDVLEMIELIRKFSAEQVVEIFFSNQDASIDFIYDKLELAAKWERLQEVWNSSKKDYNIEG